MAIRCVVLDFDGTFTDVAAEGAPFVRHFKSHLARMLGQDEGGGVVAPATADPYLLSNCVARQLMSRAGVFKDPSERHEALQTLYREAYKLTGMAFKPEAKEVLEALLDT